MSDDDLLAEAHRRYFMDPTFHAQVDVVLAVLERDLYRNTGQRMNGDDRSLAALAAASAIIVASGEYAFLPQP